tara:strand:+ start:3957 stop:6314 length:2358 start_codon:yes stop_codon:yes gene_type:complete
MNSSRRSTVIIAGRAARWACALSLLCTITAAAWPCSAGGIAAADEEVEPDAEDDQEPERDESREQPSSKTETEQKRTPTRPSNSAEVTAEQNKEPEPAAATARDKSADVPREIDTQLQVKGLRQESEPSHFDQPAAMFSIDLGNAAQGSDLAAVLEQVPGLQVRRLGAAGDPSWVGIRGSSAQQVEIWVDGSPLNPFGSAAVDLSEFPTANYDRVEIWRGFSPPELGGAPIGGVIHLISDPGPARSTEFRAALGSFGHSEFFSRISASNRLRQGGLLSGTLRMGFLGSNGDAPYFDDGGTYSTTEDDLLRRRANNRHRQFDLNGSMRLQRGPLTLSLQELLHWHRSGEPGSGQGSTEQAESEAVSILTALRGRIRAHHRLELNFNLGHRHRNARFSDLLGEIVVGATDRQDHSHHLDLGARARWQALSALQLLPAVQLLVESNQRSERIGALSPSSPRQRAAARLSLSAAASLLGGRLKMLGVTELSILNNQVLGGLPFADLRPSASEDQQAIDFLPRFALSLEPKEGLILRTSVGRGLRAPSFIELFGDRGGILGNTALRPERSASVDAGVRLRGRPTSQLTLLAEIGGFLVNSEDAIVLRANSQRLAIPVNFGATRSAGIETTVQLKLADRLQVGAALCWTDARVTAGETAYMNRQVPYIPRWDLQLSLQIRPLEWLGLSWQLSHSSGSYDSPSNLFAQAPRNIHSLNIRLEPDAQLPWISLHLNNLTNATTWQGLQDPSHPQTSPTITRRIEDFRGQPLAGRSLLFRVGWRSATAASSPQAR